MFSVSISFNLPFPQPRASFLIPHLTSLAQAPTEEEAHRRRALENVHPMVLLCPEYTGFLSYSLATHLSSCSLKSSGAGVAEGLAWQMMWPLSPLLYESYCSLEDSSWRGEEIHTHSRHTVNLCEFALSTSHFSEFLNTDFYFMSVLPACMDVHRMLIWCPMRSKPGSGSSGTGAMNV